MTFSTTFRKPLSTLDGKKRRILLQFCEMAHSCMHKYAVTTLTIRSDAFKFWLLFEVELLASTLSSKISPVETIVGEWKGTKNVSVRKAGKKIPFLRKWTQDVLLLGKCHHVITRWPIGKATTFILSLHSSSSSSSPSYCLNFILNSLICPFLAASIFFRFLNAPV